MPLTCSNDGCVGGIEELGELAVTELLLDWLNPFITRVERDRIVTGPGRKPPISSGIRNVLTNDKFLA